MKKIIGLADCNNFFVSCEKVFRPDLNNRPVVVLSNNDGCVVSRSAEVKALGIPMGAPRFKIQNEIDRYGITVFSSNFPLYGDMSNRVMSTLSRFTPDLEQYSIDEAFFNAGSVPVIRENLTEAGRQIRAYILKTTGIPVSIGFAPSKTLAKLANYYVKKHPEYNGVLDLTQKELQQKLLYICPLSDIWGIGRQLHEKLVQMKIKTPADLASSDYQTMGRKFGINMQKIIMELNGISCYEFVENPAPRKSIMHSSTMGTPSTMLETVSQAVCGHISAAAESMRRDRQCTSCLTVFYRTGAFKADGEFFSATRSQTFTSPVSDTRILIHSGLRLLEQTWRQGYQISKVGIILSELTSQDMTQMSMFNGEEQKYQNDRLMKVMDEINRSDKGRVFFLGQGINKPWGSVRKFHSPRYTTCWNEILKVK